MGREETTRRAGAAIRQLVRWGPEQREPAQQPNRLVQALLLPPPNHDRLLERHPHLRKPAELLGRHVELQARATPR
jgi:hypothetical protein